MAHPQDPERIARMFSAIARRYDLANHVLSFNQDKRWRKFLVNLAAPQSNERLLDVATGTGDIAIAFAQTVLDLKITGLDISPGMLGVAAQKLKNLKLSERVTLIEGNALTLPFSDESFEIVTIGFGLRNLPDRARGIAEMSRVLGPSGRLLMLEFSAPLNTLWRNIYLFYLGKMLPWCGGLLTGSRKPYEYLRDSIRAFPERGSITQLMNAQGFEHISLHELNGGLATIYQGHKSRR
ncbi:bifunctional demethylmenaquinone methyltransferase/2-methoxy-6-polyprenyl-1,4-benzoquinol methylase UbiE [Candidatus Acetothermia bacterium]|nr:bifunctional demethylmenaquinone methyltransferase/2-methoxy-6-polyprenyl-1,4-benzoquinol methylase UbiE [Candidatus Acetothermia bacterium]MBI3461066.1 bifunctional demethylmenaquinone methyltransferase/2-methoxy-6-polyprenyl-1,4-benzoquinol methylase UbiE [Candidatus Acetothermia bacterium]MBI3661348.1 bifunctional demethylmenaquinone methyltransferase/2-methoxy-6-polyprenyl-1,4-benzoquinol methylase UbiE [Candidatus Acetothermia bacterium]